MIRDKLNWEKVWKLKMNLVRRWNRWSFVIHHYMKDVRSGIKKGGSCINEKDLDEEEKERKKEGEVKAGNEGTSGWGGRWNVRRPLGPHSLGKLGLWTVMHHFSMPIAASSERSPGRVGGASSCSQPLWRQRGNGQSCVRILLTSPPPPRWRAFQGKVGDRGVEVQDCRGAKGVAGRCRTTRISSAPYFWSN